MKDDALAKVKEQRVRFLFIKFVALSELDIRWMVGLANGAE